MSISTIMKKRTNFFLLTLVLIIIGLIITYIVFSGNSLNKNILINNKNIKVIFENGKSGIKFGEYPMTYQQGIENSPSNKFKVINKSKQETTYQIIVTDESEVADVIDMNKIVVGINDSETKILSDVVDGIIYTSSIQASGEDIIDLKFWLNKDLSTPDDLKKSIKLKVNVKEK